jgi:hypothetical protein
VYQGNLLQGKRKKGRGMERNKIQRQEGKRSYLASMARKKGMMMTIAGNYILRRDQSGLKKEKGGKQLQKKHGQ